MIRLEMKNYNAILNLIWWTFLVDFSGGKITPPPPPCLKLVRITLETHKYTSRCGFKKYTF